MSNPPSRFSRDRAKKDGRRSVCTSAVGTKHRPNVADPKVASEDVGNSRCSPSPGDSGSDRSTRPPIWYSHLFCPGCAPKSLPAPQRHRTAPPARRGHTALLENSSQNQRLMGPAKVVAFSTTSRSPGLKPRNVCDLSSSSPTGLRASIPHHWVMFELSSDQTRGGHHK